LCAEKKDAFGSSLGLKAKMSVLSAKDKSGHRDSPGWMFSRDCLTISNEVSKSRDQPELKRGGGIRRAGICDDRASSRRFIRGSFQAIDIMSRMRDDSGEEGIYDLANEVPRAVETIKPHRVSTLAAPLEYRSKKSAAAVSVYADTIKNLYMPLWLLGGGVVVEVVAAFLRDGVAAAALIDVGLELIVGTAVMLAGILLAARLRGLQLGPFWTAAFKLSAIAVAPAAALDLAWPILRMVPLFGGLIGLAGDFVLYFALLGALFDLEESDTWYCVWVIFIVRVVVYFALLGAEARWG
jgi:hypothetical protein